MVRAQDRIAVARQRQLVSISEPIVVWVEAAVGGFCFCLFFLTGAAVLQEKKRQD